jgi:hypothetical protein
VAPVVICAAVLWRSKTVREGVGVGKEGGSGSRCPLKGPEARGEELSHDAKWARGDGCVRDRGESGWRLEMKAPTGGPGMSAAQGGMVQQRTPARLGWAVAQEKERGGGKSGPAGKLGH